MTYPLVLVRWHDAWFDYDQPGTWKDDCPIETVGYLVRETDDIISISQESLDDDTFRATTHIPAAIVQDITDLVPRQL